MKCAGFTLLQHAVCSMRQWKKLVRPTVMAAGNRRMFGLHVSRVSPLLCVADIFATLNARACEQMQPISTFVFSSSLSALNSAHCGCRHSLLSLMTNNECVIKEVTGQMTSRIRTSSVITSSRLRSGCARCDDGVNICETRIWPFVRVLGADGPVS